MIISQTPFRISFFGGGTDFPEYYLNHGGSVLATAIDKYCYLSLHRLGPFFKYRIRANYSRTEAVNEPREFAHPLIRESLLLLGCDESLEISHIADLPGRTGIGSSSSFTVGLLHALHGMRGDTVDADTLAREAIDVERVRVKDTGGHQDQYAAAFGGFSRIDFNRDGRIVVKQLAIDAARLGALQERLMIFYTGVEQSAETILSEQSKRTQVNLGTLDKMKSLVDQAVSVLESRAALGAFGELLHDSWMHKKSLAGGISNNLIDDAYVAARSAGAVGGKLLGAGGRGFLLVYAEPDCHARIRNAMSGMAEVDFAFSPEGSRIIFNNKNT